MPIVKTCAVHANAWEISKLGYEYLICLKYSKYVEGLLINMSHFYIHRGPP
jgi:hypothetical protein